MNAWINCAVCAKRVRQKKPGKLYCFEHYQANRPRKTIEERIWPHVLKTDTCWIWTGARRLGAYGNVNLGDRWQPAHRAVYELLVGPIPEGLQLDHLCRNPPCVNPAHLEPVTGAENVRRARPEGCRRGHKYTPDNLYARPDGKGFNCLACIRLRTRVEPRGLLRSAGAPCPEAPNV